MARYKRIRKKGSLTKPDEFISFWEKTAKWLVENRNRLLTPALVFMLVIVVAGGLYFYRQQKSVTAQLELYFLLKNYPHAEKAPASYMEGLSGALEEFTGRFSDSHAATVADLYRAHALARQGKTDETEKLYKQILNSDGKKTLINGVAALSLARLYHDQGKYKESTGALTLFSGGAASPFAEEIDLMKARNLEQGGNKEAALAEYRRFITNHQDSPFVPDVSEKIANLLVK